MLALAILGALLTLVGSGSIGQHPLKSNHYPLKSDHACFTDTLIMYNSITHKLSKTAQQFRPFLRFFGQHSVYSLYSKNTSIMQMEQQNDLQLIALVTYMSQSATILINIFKCINLHVEYHVIISGMGGKDYMWPTKLLKSCIAKLLLYCWPFHGFDQSTPISRQPGGAQENPQSTARTIML